MCDFVRLFCQDITYGYVVSFSKICMWVWVCVCFFCVYISFVKSDCDVSRELPNIQSMKTNILIWTVFPFLFYWLFHFPLHSFSSFFYCKHRNRFTCFLWIVCTVQNRNFYSTLTLTYFKSLLASLMPKKMEENKI